MRLDLPGIRGAADGTGCSGAGRLSQLFQASEGRGLCIPAAHQPLDVGRPGAHLALGEEAFFG